jgi:hypothetical protein
MFSTRERNVGRIYMVDVHGQGWSWGLSAELTSDKSGHASTLEKAKAAFRRAYLAWQGTVMGRE